MRALGRGSVAAVLRGVLEALRIVLFLFIGALAILAAASAYVYLAGGEVALPGVEIGDLDPWYMTALGFAVAAGWAVVMLVVVDRLRRIFATLAAGDPFVPENAGHLRVIWVVMAVYEFARTLIAIAAGAAIHLSGVHAQALGLSASVNVNLSIWFAVLVIFVLAEVFREGARMRQEQQLTI